MKKGKQTAYQVCLEMSWLKDIHPGGVPGRELSPWDLRLAMLEALAHLEAMRAEGRVERIQENEFFVYANIED